MKLGTHVYHYDQMILTTMYMNIFHGKKVLEVLTFEPGCGGVPCCVAEGLVLFVYLSAFIAHCSRVSSKLFTFTCTTLAMLPG
jgi:hypothetical protein